MKTIYTRKMEEIFVDDGDYESLNQYVWAIRRTESGYPSVLTNVPNKEVKSGKVTVTMSRMILGFKKGDPLVDHEDRNPLNNVRRNLRPATRGQNNSNSSIRKSKATSTYKGVFPTESGKFKAIVACNNQDHYLGIYTTELEAAIAYNHGAKEHHKDFASFNDIEGWQLITPKSGVKSNPGVSLTYGGKYRAYAQVKGKTQYIGVFSTELLAVEARQKFLSVSA